MIKTKEDHRYGIIMQISQHITLLELSHLFLLRLVPLSPYIIVCGVLILLCNLNCWISKMRAFPLSLIYECIYYDRSI